MDKRYELYCLADRLFYDTPNRILTKDFNFDIASRPLPPGWHLEPGDEWLVVAPPEPDIPRQGWKVHVSAGLHNAEKVLHEVWEYCVVKGLSFKFLRSRQVLYLRNAKYAPRGHSGKLITVYPRDDRQFEIVVRDLQHLLSGESGPYILSDLRIGDGPVYVRYGGFAERYCESPSGDLVPAIENAEGILVPDRRGAVFSLPEWVGLPAFLAEHLEKRNSVTITDIPYAVERALHFSNGGGVYVARHRETGKRVVLKEARPHAGLAIDKADAVARLDREAAALERLDGLAVVPRLEGRFTIGDHRFLALEFIEGEPLNRTFAERHPLLAPEPVPEAVAEYAEWAMSIHRAVERAVQQVHERGVVINDLHMFNIMVRPSGDVALIDFEAAALDSEGSRQILAAPGFQAPPGRTGFDVDAFALASLRLAVFLPITVLLTLDPGKATDLAEVIAGEFPVPREYLDEAVHEITRETTRPGVRRTDLARWPDARRSLTRAITHSATPERDDRLFPGDIRQFDGRGHGLAHGAAGVLYALDVTGAGRSPEHEDWLINHAIAPGGRLGLYDGLLGDAYVLEHLGHRKEALATVEACLAEKWERLGTNLSDGLAGVALTLAHLADRTGETELADAALRAAGLVADRLEGAGETSGISGGDHPHAGLMRGSSGPALLFLRMYERDGDPALLDLAATALRQDLSRCIRDPYGGLQVNEGWRTMPYLARGSAGIGCVLDDFLAHREDEELAEASAAIRRAALSPFYIQPGLFDGRAGIIYYLARRGDPEVPAQIRNLAWHAIDYREGRDAVAFPGEQLQRLSMDLATGTAGVLLALGAVLHDEPVGLPFMSPEGEDAPRGDRRGNGEEVFDRGASGHAGNGTARGRWRRK